MKKKSVEDLSIEIQQKMKQEQESYNDNAAELLKYINEILNSAMLQFKADKRMDKLQELQALGMNFVDKVIIEKNALNFYFVNTELKMDPTLGHKLEIALGKKIIPNGKLANPNDQGNGNIKFNRG